MKVQVHFIARALLVCTPEKPLRIIAVDREGVLTVMPRSPSVDADCPHSVGSPGRVEETVMVATSRGEARRKGELDDSDISGDERNSRASSESGDDKQTDWWATDRGPVLWPAARTVNGKTEYKDVRVYGDTTLREADARGGCTRVPFDPRDLAASDFKGDYCLLPDKEVQEFYRPKTVKREVLFWPAVRTVGGKEEYTHVRVQDDEHSCGDCARVKKCSCFGMPSERASPWADDYILCECIRQPLQCDDCTREPLVDSTQVPFDKRDLIATDGGEDYRLLPDHEVLSLYFHDETTTKENDDGDHQWMSAEKGAAIKVKGEGRAAHISDVIGVDIGQLEIGKEAWGMMQEDKDANTGRSGQYYGRKEGEGEDGHATKYVQDAVKLLKVTAKECGVVKTANDPSTAAVFMTVGMHQDGYWTCERMCTQLWAIIAHAELTSAPHRQGVFIFDNSTGHGAYDDDALLAHKINMSPGGEKIAFAKFEDDHGKTVYSTFQVGDTLRTDKKIVLPKTAEQKKDKRRKFGTALPKKDFPVGTVVQRGSQLLGLNKGAEQLLKKMGLWQLEGERKGLVLCCKQCKAENSASRQAITAFNRGGGGRARVLEQAAQHEQQDPSTAGQAAGGTGGRRQRCCAVRVFSELKAFKEVLNKVEQIFKDAGHVCIFLPKYHPELNAIERHWGYIKHLLRLHCEYKLSHMLKILPGTMSGVPLEFIRAWSRVKWLYVAAYDEGLVDYLETRDLTEWGKHREATKRGDAVVEARGAVKTAKEKAAAEAKALAAAQKCRTFSTRRTKRAFKKWKGEKEKERQEKEAENDVS